MKPHLCIEPQCPSTCEGCQYAVPPDDIPRQLIARLLCTFALDDRDLPYEDGDHPLVDRARAYLRREETCCPKPTESAQAIDSQGKTVLPGASAASGVAGTSDASAWWALVMGAAASIEDAANCLRDPDAKKQAEGAAKHYREAAQKLWAASGVMSTHEPQREAIAHLRGELQAASNALAHSGHRADAERAQAAVDTYGVGEVDRG